MWEVVDLLGVDLMRIDFVSVDLVGGHLHLDSSVRLLSDMMQVIKNWVSKLLTLLHNKALMQLHMPWLVGRAYSWSIKSLSQECNRGSGP